MSPKAFSPPTSNSLLSFTANLGCKPLQDLTFHVRLVFLRISIQRLQHARKRIGLQMHRSVQVSEAFLINLATQPINKWIDSEIFQL